MTSQPLKTPRSEVRLRRALIIGLFAFLTSAGLWLLAELSQPSYDKLTSWRQQIGASSLGVGNLFATIMGVMLFYPGFQQSSGTADLSRERFKNLSNAFWLRFVIGALTIPAMLHVPAALVSTTIPPPSGDLRFSVVILDLAGVLLTSPMQYLAIYSTSVLVGSVIKRPIFATSFAAVGMMFVLGIPEWCRPAGTSPYDSWGYQGAMKGAYHLADWSLFSDVPLDPEWIKYGAFFLFHVGITVTCAFAAYFATLRDLAWRKKR